MHYVPIRRFPVMAITAIALGPDVDRRVSISSDCRWSRSYASVCRLAAEALGAPHSRLSNYYGMTMAPDRTPWVGFAQECPFGLPVAGNANCPSTLIGAANDGLIGLVGRLVRPRGAEDDED